MKGYKWDFKIEKGSCEEKRMRYKSRYEEYDKTELNKIAEAVASVWGTDVKKIMVQRRFPELVHPRQMIMAFARLQDINHWFIAFYLGYTDHSNIIHGVKATSDRCDTEPDFLKKYNEVKKKLENPEPEIIIEHVKTLEDINSFS